MNNNSSRPNYFQGLRKRVGVCIESNVNWEFIDVSYLTCLKLVLIRSQNWDSSYKNLHSQLPLKIVPSDLQGRPLPLLQLAAAAEAVAPSLRAWLPFKRPCPYPLPQPP